MQSGNEKPGFPLNDKMSFLRMVDLLVNPPLTLYFFTVMQSGNEKPGFPLNDKMSFIRMVDLLVNPPLTLYFFTEMQSGNEKTRLQVERHPAVPPDG